MGQNGPKLVFNVPVVIERWKSIIVKENLWWGICFWNHYLRILKFWLQWWHNKPKNGSKSSCVNIDRKMKIKSKRYFEVKYLFMKAFFRNFEVLTLHGDIINPTLARIRSQTHISCTNGHRKMKINRKRKSEVRYSFKKLFSWNC